MRYAQVLLLLVMPLVTGCTAAILRSGVDTLELKTREDVRREFGTPDSSGQIAESSFDEFNTRRIVAMHREAWVAEHASVFTLGLFDIIGVPAMLVQAGYLKLAGQDLRVVYDSAGNVISVHVDGESPEFGARSKKDLKPPAKETGAE